MKLGKETEGIFVIVRASTQEEVEKYKSEGYELIAETDRPSSTATNHYERVENGWVQVWEDNKEIPAEEVEEINV